MLAIKLVLATLILLMPIRNLHTSKNSKAPSATITALASGIHSPGGSALEPLDNASAGFSPSSPASVLRSHSSSSGISLLIKQLISFGDSDWRIASVRAYTAKYFPHETVILHIVHANLSWRGREVFYESKNGKVRRLNALAPYCPTCASLCKPYSTSLGREGNTAVEYCKTCHTKTVLVHQLTPALRVSKFENETCWLDRHKHSHSFNDVG